MHLLDVEVGPSTAEGVGRLKTYAFNRGPIRQHINLQSTKRMPFIPFQMTTFFLGHPRVTSTSGTAANGKYKFNFCQTQLER